MAENVASLIRQAQDYVRRGAVIQMHLSSGLILPEYPVAIMSLTRQMLWFLYVGGENAHGLEVDEISAGDDQQVLVRGGEDHTAIISEAWTNEQLADLRRWLDNQARAPEVLPVGPPPPDQVRFEGR